MRGSVLTILAFCFSVAPAVADLDACFDAAPAQRPACGERWAESTNLGWRDWRALERWLNVDPSGALRALDSLVARRGETPLDDARVAARVQDARGRAWEALDRPTDAAEAYLEALRIDEGTVRVARLGQTPNHDRIEEVDPGIGRLERAARALSAAGREEEARPLAARAAGLGSAVSGGDDRSAPLIAREWFRPMPLLAVESLEGAALEVPQPGAGATIVDFWASWCVPCAEELPKLEELYEELAGEGLRVATFNVGEPGETARIFADALGLSLPIALYDAAAAAAYDVRSLPTLVLLDRLGRVRGRWNGYEAGLEDDLGRLVRELLDDETAIPTRSIGEVLVGAGSLEATWIQDFPGGVDGLTLLPAERAGEEEARILLVASRGLFGIDASGVPERYRGIASAAGLLRHADLDGDGSAEVLGYRRGAIRLLELNLDDGQDRSWEAPGPVLALEPLAAAGERAGELWLGTTGGLFRSQPDGLETVAVEGFGTVLDLAVLGDRRFVLERGGRVSRLDADAVSNWTRVAPIAGERLAGGKGTRDRPLVIGAGVHAHAAGRFLEGEASQIALATVSGQLLLLDASDGHVVFRARWPGIRDLAAGDLDGDGRDDLAVASGAQVTLLQRAASDP